MLLVLCLLAPALFPARAATVVHNPYLQNMRADGVTIVWSTRENQSGAVEYSIDGSYSLRATARVRSFPGPTGGLSRPFYQYQADLTGLAPATAYSYRVMMDGQNLTPEPEYRFRTTAPGPFSFLVYGDSGNGSDGQQALTPLMAAEKPDLVLHVGDIAYESGTFDEFQAYYFSFYSTIMRRVPWFTVPGNHEYLTLAGLPYLSLHATPTDTVPPGDRGRYYSFDWGDVHFIALDSNLLGVGYSARDELAWLESDLSRTTAKWKVAFFHHLPYPILHHLTDPICQATREQFVPVLEGHGVQLVLTGHEHNYQRSKPLHGGAVVASGTQYITTGGGGGTLHDVVPKEFLVTQKAVFHYLQVQADATHITIRAIGLDNKEFDRVTLALPAVASSESVVNAASFAPALAPGELVSIFGSGLAADTSAAASLPLPNVLSGTTVTLNGTVLPLTYASSTQINALLPLDAQANGTLRVATASGFAEVPVAISDTAPAIFPGGILHLDNTPVSSASPARPGEVLVIYMTGLGQVDGGLINGQATPASPLLRVLAPVAVQMGDLSVAPAFAGLTPGSVGLYQVNVVVPQDLPPKVYPLRVSAKGNLSNTLNFQVQPRN